MKWIRRKLFEFGLKIALRYQSVAIITGPTIYLYYKNSPPYKVFKNYEMAMMPYMDAYLVTKKGESK